ncbi:unnamed protein product [Brassica oleracea]
MQRLSFLLYLSSSFPSLRLTVSVCTGMETDIKMEKNWCYVFCVHKEAPTNGLILFI